MNALDIRRLATDVLWIVIFFTILAAVAARWDLVRGLWLAIGWQGASVAALAVCARLLQPPFTRGRAWALAGMVCVKFPVFYALGWLALQWCDPSPLGLVMGLTLPWAVVAGTAIVHVARTA